MATKKGEHVAHAFVKSPDRRCRFLAECVQKTYPKDDIVQMHTNEYGKIGSLASLGG
jgi:hypothetical protein